MRTAGWNLRAWYCFSQKANAMSPYSRQKNPCGTQKYGVSKSVAVTVSPTKEQVEQIMRLGFDYIQIHGTLSDEVHDVLRIPVIRAVNVAGETAEDKESIRRQLESVLADEKRRAYYLTAVRRAQEKHLTGAC